MVKNRPGSTSPGSVPVSSVFFFLSAEGAAVFWAGPVMADLNCQLAEQPRKGFSVKNCLDQVGLRA